MFVSHVIKCMFFFFLAHLVKPINAYVNWDSQTGVDIDRQYRALGDMVIGV